MKHLVLASVVATLATRASAASELTFFEHTSCNAGTSFAEYADPGALPADTSCHPLPGNTVAVYVNEVDDGCTVRTYTGSDCDPSTDSLAGLLIGAGTCFYLAQAVDVDLRSWRADCPGVDYSATNGSDTGTSYSTDQTDPAVESALMTATGGAVTFSAAAATSSAAQSSAVTPAKSTLTLTSVAVTASTTGVATTTTTTTEGTTPAAATATALPSSSSPSSTASTSASASASASASSTATNAAGTTLRRTGAWVGLTVLAVVVSLAS